MELRDQLQSALGTSYTLERELHGGGMSRVFVAQDETLGRRVVVKVLAPELGGSVNFDRFKREISVAARLQHPHIVPLLSAGEIDGVPYFTMPFVEGESLRAHVARGELPVAEAVAILRDIAKALDYAHSKGVVHRDIKPDNVLLTNGSAAVTDFGVAKAISSSTQGEATLTSIGVALGTPAYMAPEQASADPATDHRADIYAFGVTAYEMLAGRSPFAARSAQQLFAAHATAIPTSLERVRPAVPPAVAELVMRCLEKRPADRPQNAREVLAALDGISTPSRISALARPERSRRTNWVATGGVAFAVVVAVAIPFLRTSRRTPLNPKRVMVAPFENATRDTSLALVGRITSDYITEGISQLDSVEAVPSATVLAATSTNGLVANARQFAEQQRAGTLISGSIYRQGDSLRFHAEVTEVAGGKLVLSLSDVAGPASDPIRGIRLLRERLMGAIAIRDERASQRLQGAPRYEAYELFMRALDRFQRQDYRGAMEPLHQAIALDSTFGTAMTLLATAHSNLQEWAATDSVAKIAERRRDRMSKSDREHLDWVLANIKGDLESTHRLAQVEAARDSAWVPLWLTSYHALWLNRPRETIRILSGLKPPPGWIPYWNALGSAHHSLGEFDEELRVGESGNAAYPGRLVVVELRALGAKGDISRTRAMIDSIERTSTDTIATPADHMLSVALELRAHGHERDADDMLTHARQWIATRQAELSKRRGLRRTAANVFFASRQFDSAQTRYAALAAEDTFDIMARGRTGSSAALRGDTATARRIAAELSSIARPYTFGEPAYWGAAIAAALGDKETAVRLLTEALARGDRKMPEIHRLEEFQALRGYEPFEAILRPKG
jgi:serine/threonine protein kinase/tetratricopeptide (TPR) repeat protein